MLQFNHVANERVTEMRKKFGFISDPVIDGYNNYFRDSLQKAIFERVHKEFRTLPPRDPNDHSDVYAPYTANWSSSEEG